MASCIFSTRFILLALIHSFLLSYAYGYALAGDYGPELGHKNGSKIQPISERSESSVLTNQSPTFGDQSEGASSRAVKCDWCTVYPT